MLYDKQFENYDGNHETTEILEERINNVEKNIQDVLNQKSELNYEIPSDLIERIENLENNKFESHSMVAINQNNQEYEERIKLRISRNKEIKL